MLAPVIESDFIRYCEDHDWNWTLSVDVYRPPEMLYELSMTRPSEEVLVHAPTPALARARAIIEADERKGI